uniref:Uncharacterized protein n=1 Tax=Arundo donax TaxID=35708 RepID=A0A0A9C4A3_ARUDO
MCMSPSPQSKSQMALISVHAMILQAKISQYLFFRPSPCHP